MATAFHTTYPLLNQQTQKQINSPDHPVVHRATTVAGTDANSSGWSFKMFPVLTRSLCYQAQLRLGNCILSPLRTCSVCQQLTNMIYTIPVEDCEREPEWADSTYNFIQKRGGGPIFERLQYVHVCRRSIAFPVNSNEQWLALGSWWRPMGHMLGRKEGIWIRMWKVHPPISATVHVDM